MKKARHGFTLIEVSLFLAVTAALFLGIVTATQNSIFQQRFTDSVQNFAEFMRSVYSQVANVQNEKTGRSKQAIYGKVVTFDVDDEGRNQIKSYNLIADVEFHEVIDEVGDAAHSDECNRSGSVIAKLACLNANIVTKDNTGKYHTVGFVTDYTPTWSAGLQTVEGWQEDVRDSAGNIIIDNPGFLPYKGIIVITHSPDSGNIFTYVMQSTDGPQKAAKVDEIIDAIAACENSSTCANDNPFVYENTSSTGASSTKHLFVDTFDGQSAFTTTEVNFCINPYGTERTTLRRNIRIPKGNHTASGIQVVDDSENSCREEN